MKNSPIIFILLIVLLIAAAVGLYYARTGGNNGYLYEITDDGVNPGAKGPFPETAPYVEPPTVPPPSGN
ncbi:MAG: hypothetical protein WC269_04125 [Candidatus Gracilibacteria bacterium]|jgi:hypothetical protein